MIRCVAIDDRVDSIKVLEQYILDTPNMRMVASFSNPLVALSEVKQMDLVDAIFMDIEMPQISGLELAGALRPKTKRLIFTTSHPQFAMQAFEAEADAYLLKPFGYAKFALTLSRLFERDLNEVEIQEYFLVKNKAEDHRVEMVKYNDIIAFESFHNYIKIHTAERIIIAYLSLKDVREQLDIKKGFIQLHRGYIVSIAHIKHIEGNRISLIGGINFVVGDLYHTDFKTFFKEKLILTNRKK